MKLKLSQYNKKLETANLNGSSLSIRMNKYDATELLIKKSLHEAQFGSESVQVKNKKLFADIESLEGKKGEERDLHSRLLKKHHIA